MERVFTGCLQGGADIQVFPGIRGEDPTKSEVFLANKDPVSLKCMFELKSSTADWTWSRHCGYLKGLQNISSEEAMSATPDIECGLRCFLHHSKIVFEFTPSLNGCVYACSVLETSGNATGDVKTDHVTLSEDPKRKTIKSDTAQRCSSSLRLQYVKAVWGTLFSASVGLICLIHYLALRPVLKRIEEETLKARVRAQHAEEKIFGEPRYSDIEKRYKRIDQNLEAGMSCDSMFDALEAVEGAKNPITGKLRFPRKPNDESDHSVDLVQWLY